MKALLTIAFILAILFIGYRLFDLEDWGEF